MYEHTRASTPQPSRSRTLSLCPSHLLTRTPTHADGGHENFLRKGRLGPGMHLVHEDFADTIKGGVISSSRRHLGRIAPEKAAIPGPGSYSVALKSNAPSTQFA